MRILLAEDDEVFGEALRRFLVSQRYLLDVATDGDEAWFLLEAGTYDLAIIDVMLPRIDGIELCRRLRAAGKRLPVLLLTARDAASDKVHGFDAGADDYVVKPVDLVELAARLRALLRRGGAALPPVLAWGLLRLDPNTCEVSYSGQPVHLTPKEYSLLELFMRNGRRVFSRSAILDHLWSLEEPPEEDTVKAHVKGLRHRLRAVGAPADLIETVYGLGYRLNPTATAPPPQPEPPAATAPAIHPALAALWERSRHNVLARLALLTRANRALLEGRLDDSLRTRAVAEAHKLAGLLGTFGYTEGSRLARALEEFFGRPEAADSGLEATGWLVALRGELERTIPPEHRSAPDGWRLLVVDVERSLTEALAALAKDAFELDTTDNPATARERLVRRRPDLVVIDLHPYGREGADHWAFLGELAAQEPPVPAVVLTDRHHFEEHRTAARLGSRAVLEKPVSAAQVLAAVERTLLRPGTAGARVMIVDDDPEMLTVLQALLKPWGLEVLILAEPLDCWQRLQEFRPDLLVLDVEMPNLDGIELCRILRSDPRWQGLPVVFLTCHTDTETVQRIFAGGADDYLAKPVAGPELAGRILNRLERSRARTLSPR